MCCVGSTVECVQDVSCDNIGEECKTGEDCTGGTIEKTRDVENCCTGKCVGTCASQGGYTCSDNEKCPTNYIDASDTIRCCPVECKKQRSLWWLWLILILIVIGALVVYFFKFRKPKPKKKIEFPGMLGQRPRPISRPIPRMARPVRPLKMAIPRPIRSPRAPIPTPKTKTKRKAESELEKTLRKLKKMSTK